MPSRSDHTTTGREGDLKAVRRGRWKLRRGVPYLTVDTVGVDGAHGVQHWVDIGERLYDLHADPGERYDRLAEHPTIVAELRALMAAHEEEVLAKAVPAWREVSAGE